jgi:hypothetical protein
MCKHSILCGLVLAAVLCLHAPAWVAAQEVQIPGRDGVVATETTVEQEHGFAHAVTLKTWEGLKYVGRTTSNLFLHGGKGIGVDPLSDLHEGTTVMVRDAAEPDGTAAVAANRSDVSESEGKVIDIDRRKRVVVVRFENRRTEKLRLADSPAGDAHEQSEAAAPEGDTLAVSYVDDMGQSVTHFFKKVS